MKKLFSAVILSTLLLISTPVLQAGGGKHHPDFYKELGLSDVQMKQIDTIKSSGADKKTEKKEIKAVLTPDQQKQLKTLKKQWKASRESGATTPTTTTNPTPTK